MDDIPPGMPPPPPVPYITKVRWELKTRPSTVFTCAQISYVFLHWFVVLSDLGGLMVVTWIQVDAKGLHLCCPYMKMERPESFQGEGDLRERGKKESFCSREFHLLIRPLEKKA